MFVSLDIVARQAVCDRAEAQLAQVPRISKPLQNIGVNKVANYILEEERDGVFTIPPPRCRDALDIRIPVEVQHMRVLH